MGHPANWLRRAGQRRHRQQKLYRPADDAEWSHAAISIAPTNVLDLEGDDGVRARAKKLLGQFHAGIDPKAERRKHREQVQRAARGTLRAVPDDSRDCSACQPECDVPPQWILDAEETVRIGRHICYRNVA